MYKDAKGKWIADLGNGNYKNPILFADYSDPDVIRVGDDFFMVSSSFTYFPGMPVLHSKDLVNWKIISHAVEKMPFEIYDKPQHGKGIWAPSIRFHDGKFYVYFGDPDLGIFMANTEDPFGKWNDVVCVKEAYGWIDPCPLWDDDGRAYLVHAFAKSRCGFKSRLAVSEMSPDGTKLIGEDKMVFDGRINHPTIEGPKFYKKDGFYYILAPAGGVRTGWQMAGRSKDVYGPYEHKIIMHQGDSPINGPHQGGLVDLDNGESWFIHFQDLNAYGRVAHLQPAKWVDGWPLIGVDTNHDFVGEPVLEYKKPTVNCETEICTPDTSDDFSGKELGLQWQWQAHENKSFYELGNNELKLFAMPVLAEDGKEGFVSDAANLLSQLIQAPNFEAVTKVKLNLPEDGDTAGLTITGGNYYCIRIENCNGKFVLKQTNFEHSYPEHEEKITGTKEIDNVSEIYFKAVMEYNAQTDFYYSLDGVKYEKLGERVEYIVSRKSWVGGRIGLFCMNNKGKDSKGFASFEYIDIK